MKFSSPFLTSVALLLAGSGGGVHAQQLQQEPSSCAAVASTAVPACARPCFLVGTAAVGCAVADLACRCDRQAGLLAAVEGCVAASCAPGEFQGVIDGDDAVCRCVSGDVDGRELKRGVSVSASPSPSAFGSASFSFSFSSMPSSTPSASVGVKRRARMS